ncbi:MAG: type II toxin-antitoxin system HicB family antitoxin [Defluviitaleaceae bacterium]|nr:type II toxin-antitoxin system HicB family antitoxin [Defluviitaleaceae bacterium]
MSNYIKHRGYVGTVEYTAEDDVLFGKVLGIRGLVSYEGESIAAVKRDFMEAVDDYLETCEIEGLEPENPVIPMDDAQKTA